MSINDMSNSNYKHLALNGDTDNIEIEEYNFANV